MGPQENVPALDDDVKVLHEMGYAQELSRRLSRFSNFAISFSIICILSGAVNSLAQATSGAGGAALGLGWPLGVMMSGMFGLAMAQIASAFPTAGGLYHWGSILGNRFTGWLTAWFNLLGLITVLGAINVGAYYFFLGAFGPLLHWTDSMWTLIAFISVLGGAQALINHYGISLTAKLTDFSGYLIFATSTLLAVVCFACARHYDFSRLWTFTNYSGAAGGNVWPRVSGGWIFLLGLLLPIYTITGYDASAHTSEETVQASVSVPRGIVSSIIWSGVFGYVFLVAFLLMIPDMDAAARQGWNVFFWAMDQRVPFAVREILYALIFLSQVLCGLATVTSTSRMIYAFSRDGGSTRLPAPGARLAHAPDPERGDLDRRNARAAVRLRRKVSRGERHARLHRGRLLHRDLPFFLVRDTHRARTVRLWRAALAQDGAVEHGARRLLAVRRAVDRFHGGDFHHRRAASQRAGLRRHDRFPAADRAGLVRVRETSLPRAAPGREDCPASGRDCRRRSGPGPRQRPSGSHRLCERAG